MAAPGCHRSAQVTEVRLYLPGLHVIFCKDFLHVWLYIPWLRLEPFAHNLLVVRFVFGTFI